MNRIVVVRSDTANTFTVLGTFESITDAEKELRSGTITGKDIFVMSVRRHFSTIETTAVPRTHLYESERPYARANKGKRKGRKETNGESE